MESIKVIKIDGLGEVRTAVSDKGENVFCLADICRSLGLSARRVSERLSKDAVCNGILQTAGGKQKFLFVNEDGMNDVILDSRKPEAKQFAKRKAGDGLLPLRFRNKSNRTKLLERILDATCAVCGVERQNITSPKRIDEHHQNARIISCNASIGKDLSFTYSEIARMINRDKNHVSHSRKRAEASDYYALEIKEVKKMAGV
jgi:hypothetical protein